jgi:hypothetical protein
MARLPQAARLAVLPLPEQYAAVELFRGTMLRHSLVVHRDDGPARPLTFAGEAWKGYIPIRMPDTIAVGENLPAGTAAVLINRNHSWRDLYLPIDAREKPLHDAIDGTRTIREIARTDKQLGVARALFERLHGHDQIVFDASASF